MIKQSEIIHEGYMFMTLNVVMVSLVYACIQTHWIACIMYVQGFGAWELFINKTVKDFFKRKNEKYPPISSFSVKSVDCHITVYTCIYQGRGAKFISTVSENTRSQSKVCPYLVCRCHWTLQMTGWSRHTPVTPSFPTVFAGTGQGGMLRTEFAFQDIQGAFMVFTD